jgi:hypothetical protein
MNRNKVTEWTLVNLVFFKLGGIFNYRRMHVELFIKAAVALFPDERGELDNSY